MTRILMVDDHQIFLDGMRHLVSRLDEAAEVVCSDSAEVALKHVETEPEFDLILVDLGMPGINGHDCIRALMQRSVLTPVVVVSASESADDIDRVMQAGAFGFIRKSAPGDEILSAIKQILDGQIYTPVDYTPSSGVDESNTSTQELTPRQQEVLDLLAQGHPNKRIATILNVSEYTVKTHLRSLFEALKVRNRTECVNEGRQRGLLNA